MSSKAIRKIVHGLNMKLYYVADMSTVRKLWIPRSRFHGGLSFFSTRNKSNNSHSISINARLEVYQ